MASSVYSSVKRSKWWSPTSAYSSPFEAQLYSRSRKVEYDCPPTLKPRDRRKHSINHPKSMFQLFGVYSHMRPHLDISSKPALYQPPSPLKGPIFQLVESTAGAAGHRIWHSTMSPTGVPLRDPCAYLGPYMKCFGPNIPTFLSTLWSA